MTNLCNAPCEFQEEHNCILETRRIRFVRFKYAEKMPSVGIAYCFDFTEIQNR
jgi:hypothetical protein